jgi:hypothetical protein
LDIFYSGIFMGYWRKVLSILLMTAVVFLPIAGFNDINVAAGPLTTVSVELEDTVEIDVSPDGPSSVTIAGTVTCRSGSPNPVSVQLWVRTTVGTASMDKKEVLFQGGGNQTEFIHVCIEVGILEPASDEESCTVEGFWQQGATSEYTEPETTQIIILPFSKPHVYCRDPVHEKIQGEASHFKVTVVNGGNFQDTYSFEIINEEELSKNGITVEISADVTLDMGSEVDIEINYRISSNTDAGNYHVILLVGPQQPGNENEDFHEHRYTLTLEVKESNPMRFIEYYELLTLVCIGVIVVVGFVIYRRIKKHHKNNHTRH